MAVLTTAKTGLDSQAIRAGEEELQRLLLPANIRAVLRTRQDTADRFEYLFVASFAGNCSVVDVAPPRSRVLRVLGESFLQSGKILPFFNVDCDHVIQTLKPELDYLSVPLRQSLLGRAIGRVMAHEIYHILAQTALHDDSGVAKESFLRPDLVSEQFEFTPASLRRITAAIATGTANHIREESIADSGLNFE